MIEVKATGPDGTELATIRLEWIENIDQNWSRYTAEFAIERVGAVGLHRRVITFEHSRFNVLGLIQNAISALDPEDLGLEDASRY